MNTSEESKKVLKMLEHGTEETKRCPKCGAKMIKRYQQRILPTYPAQSPWDWWCACGHREKGGVDKGMSEEEVWQRVWEDAQKSQKEVQIALQNSRRKRHSTLMLR
ncbi:MAG: hypothetical protein ACXQS1_01115 [Methermicoccaceae archaeon]